MKFKQIIAYPGVHFFTLLVLNFQITKKLKR